ncbi:MAG: S1 RNA-binding domain-containing protein, partial [Actinomycetia bacterium]|nr:S1 RNA-binding domain-containing protein [Actinomycetes bacterium]
YPIGSRIDGKVVSLVDDGAFEGLIHVSEMSWTERNPWEELADSFPVGSIIEGKVRNLTGFGAFIDDIDDIDGLIHVSDMSWTKRVKHPSEVLKKGDVVKARITNIDVSNQRVSLSIKEFLPNEWDSLVTEYRVGDTLDGKVVNVTDFGLFIDIYQELEGLVQVSEIGWTARSGSACKEDYAKFLATGRGSTTRVEAALLSRSDLPSGNLEDHFSVGDGRCSPRSSPVAWLHCAGGIGQGDAVPRILGETGGSLPLGWLRPAVRVERVTRWPEACSVDADGSHTGVLYCYLATVSDGGVEAGFVRTLGVDSCYMAPTVG